ncbi:MAG: MFS transporter, partial [Jatrophihabitans sp.]
AALVYGFVSVAGTGWSSARTIAAFAVGLVLLEIFGLVEARAAAPITPLRLFADRNRAGAYAARLLLVAAMMGMFFFLTQFLRGVLGYSDLRTGFAFLPLTVAVFAASQLSSRVLVGRFGEKAVMITGVTLSTTGMLLLTHVGTHSGYLALLTPLVIFGTGNGLAFVPLTTVALERVSPQDAGAASGLVNVMQQVGGALGLSVLVTVFGTASASAAHRLGAHVPAADLAQQAFVAGARSAFWMAVAFLVGTWLLVVFAVRRAAPGGEDAARADSDLDREIAAVLAAEAD